MTPSDTNTQALTSIINTSVSSRAGEDGLRRRTEESAAGVQAAASGSISVADAAKAAALASEARSNLGRLWVSFRQLPTPAQVVIGVCAALTVYKVGSMLIDSSLELLLCTTVGAVIGGYLGSKNSVDANKGIVNGATYGAAIGFCGATLHIAYGIYKEIGGAVVGGTKLFSGSTSPANAR